MPCLSRVAVHSGAGVPLLIETHVGAAPLKRLLVPLLERLQEAVGLGADVDRLTIVDSEAGAVGTLWALHEQSDVFFVTPVKGMVRRGARITGERPWRPFRTRDRIREVTAELSGGGAPTPTLKFRGVQMERANGRNPQATLFVTNAGAEDLPAEQVVELYLARWPKQEQFSRDARNGGGLNRSHGYGGAFVQNVAMEERRASAGRSAGQAERRHDRARGLEGQIREATAPLPAPIRREVRKLAKAQERATAKQATARSSARNRLDSMPNVIYERDTTRDSIMTCLKVTVLSLLEYVAREYFGGLAMEWRTFITHFVGLAVTVHRTEERCLFRIHANRRQKERMAQLQKAIDEINRRQIRREDELLEFELVHRRDRGSTPQIAGG